MALPRPGMRPPGLYLRQDLDVQAREQRFRCRDASWLPALAPSRIMVRHMNQSTAGVLRRGPQAPDRPCFSVIRWLHGPSNGPLNRLERELGHPAALAGPVVHGLDQLLLDEATRR